MTMLLATLPSLVCSLILVVHALGDDPVTLGSVLKLEHVSSGYRLHSHSLPYASGSGQQSVTGMQRHGDSNSYWILKEPHPDEADGSVNVHVTGGKVECGATIRLQHLNTQKNLHSHLVVAPMNSDQEVSAFAEESNEVWKDGDSGDNWVVVCERKRNGDTWSRSDKFYLQHVDTGNYLTTSARLQYDDPISGQLHVSARKRRNSECLWRAAEGFFIAMKSS